MMDTKAINLEELLKKITVNITGGTLSQEEQWRYLAYAYEKYADNLYQVDFEVDGDYVNATVHLRGAPFERYRRITGYISQLNTWNDAKRAEEHDRVKHC